MTEIPFHLLCEDVPIITIPVSLDGEGPFDFVLDTGNVSGETAKMLLSESLARRLAIEAADCEEFEDSYAVGDGSQPQIRGGRVRSAALGDIVLNDVAVGVTPMLEELSSQIGATIDGNIGYTFLKDYAVSIDYDAATIRLDQGSDAIAGEPFHLAVDRPLVVVPVRINGRGPHHFAVDTGAGHTVISHRLAVELGLERGESVVVLGGAGNTGGYTTMLESVEVAGAGCANLPVAVGDFFDAVNDTVGLEIDGVIGYDILRHFHVTIDYLRSKFALSRTGS